MTKTQKVSGWKLLWHLILYTPKLYLVDSLLWILIEGFFPAVPGLIIREFFNALTGTAIFRLSPWTFIALLLAAGLGQIIAIFAGRVTKTQHRFTMSSLVQRNFLACLLNRPGAHPLVASEQTSNAASPGEVMSYFRDDAAQIEDNVVGTNELASAGLFALGSIAILLSVNARMTLFVFLPLVGIAALLRQARSRIERYRRASRQATQQVTGLIGELFGSVQAIQVAGAKPDVLHHFRQVNEQRRQLMVKDQLLTAVLNSSFSNMVSVGTGLILLLAAQSIQAGGQTLTVGDFALFVYYLAFVTSFLDFLGGFLTTFKQTDVSFERMAELLQGTMERQRVEKTERSSPHSASTYALVAHNPLYLPNLLGRRPELPPVEQPQRDASKRLQVLMATNLTYRYPNTDRGIRGVTLKIRRGSFTAITGAVGSGKTTLLRVLLGLLPMQAGEIRWNGHLVEDPSSFFGPSRSAYTPQVPKLFSDSLRENILLGLDKSETDLAKAIALSVFEQDVAAMPEGLETIIGSKGVRLSGGQLQRAAAARMLVRQPELLVFDDLSSALDVETEKTLWECLFRARSSQSGSDTTTTEWTPTCLVVSHRRSVLQRADQIIMLNEGQVKAVGQLSELLATCGEVQRLWQGE